MSINVQLYDYSMPEKREDILDGFRALSIKGAPCYNMVIVSVISLEEEEITKIYI
jgi:hypothetical protein